MCVNCFAQFVGVEIDIMPQVKVQPLSDTDTNISENQQYNNALSKTACHSNLHWIEISSDENLLILVDIKALCPAGSAPFVYVINNGHFDRSQARTMDPLNILFHLNMSDKTEVQSKQTRFRAWLGISQGGFNELHIVYN